MVRVADAVASLAQPERDALVLHVWEGLAYDGIAVALDVPIGTVRSRLNPARTRLRELAPPSGEERDDDIHGRGSGRIEACTRRPCARTGGPADVINGLAHTAVCVPDVEAAVAWYRDVLGLDVLSPPYLMEGEAIAQDMGELVPSPRMRAAIVGFASDGDRVLEVIEYPDSEGGEGRRRAALTDHGLTHVALRCDDIDATRATLEQRGVHFLTKGIADVARLRTTWFEDPWGVVFILIEKSKPARPYYAQYGG